MSKEVKDVLKEAAKDILSEETLNELQNMFNDAVSAKVKLHVEKALIEQDEDYSNKLEKLVNAIDSDHTEKLKQVYEAVVADHTEKLKQIISKYENASNGDAKNFKNNLVENISNYLELYIDEAIPAAAINEAVKNKRANAVLDNIKNALSVNEASVNDSIRDAIVDGKKQIDEANKKLEAVLSENEALKSKIEKISANNMIAEKTKGMDPKKVEQVFKLLNGKDPKFVIENFDYTVKMFDKSEEERLETLASEAVEESSAVDVDRPVVEEKVVTESTATSQQSDDSANFYLKELSKY
jgi:hypothetical protein